MKTRRRSEPIQKRKTANSNKYGLRTRSMHVSKTIYLTKEKKVAEELTTIKIEETECSKSRLQHTNATSSSRATVSIDKEMHDEQGIIYDEDKFYCKNCDHTFSSKASLHRHLRNVHKLLIVPPQTKPNPHLLPDVQDPNFYCRACEKTSRDYTAYHNHLKDVHKMKNIPQRERIRHPHITPDVNNPKFYCKACEKTLCSKANYFLHLETVHKMVTPRSRAVVNPHLLPNINDQNLHCIACEKDFKRRSQFEFHLIAVHRMAVPISSAQKKAVLNPHAKLDFDNPSSYCQACEKAYESRTGYRHHLMRVHKMIPPLARIPTPQKTIVNPGVIPNVDDPDHYCSACERTYPGQNSYRVHLKSVHKMKLTPLCRQIKTLHPHLTPDENDPNFYCSACEFSFKRKDTFRRHLIRSHKMKLKTIWKKIIANPNAKIDPDDPDHYCNACERKLKNKSTYRDHLRTIHHMKLPDAKLCVIVNPDKPPDPNDPNHFCRMCERHYNTQNNYRSHLDGVHKMDVRRRIKRRKMQRLIPNTGTRTRGSRSKVIMKENN